MSNSYLKAHTCMRKNETIDLIFLSYSSLVDLSAAATKPRPPAGRTTIARRQGQCAILAGNESSYF